MKLIVLDPLGFVASFKLCWLRRAFRMLHLLTCQIVGKILRASIGLIELESVIIVNYYPR